MPVSVHLAPELLAQVDVAAESLGISRSDLIRLALSHYLNSEGFYNGPSDKKKGVK